MIPQTRLPVVLLIALLAFAHALLYAFIVPLWQAPDEPAHVEYVLLVAERGPWADAGDASVAIQEAIVRDMLARDYFARGFGQQPTSDTPTFEDVWPGTVGQLGRPPLYRMLGAGVVWLVGDLPVDWLAMVLRVYSALLFAATVAVTYATARLVFPSRPALAAGAASAHALLPMAAYLGGSVSNDNLAGLICSLAFLVVAYSERRGYRLWTLAALLLLVVAAFLTKRTALLVAPLAAAVLLSLVIRASGPIRLAGAAVVGAVAVFGAWLVLVPTPAQTFALAIADRYIANASFAYDVWELVNSVVDWTTIPYLTDLYGIRTFEGFWATYGWFNVRPEAALFLAPALLTALSAVGVLVFAVRRLSEQDDAGRWSLRWLAVGAGLALILVVLYALNYSDDGTLLPQGRYLFVGLTPMVILAAAGLAELVPNRLRPTGATFVLMGLLCFDLAAIAVAVIPAFYA